MNYILRLVYNDGTTQCVGPFYWRNAHGVSKFINGVGETVESPANYGQRLKEQKGSCVVDYQVVALSPVLPR